MVSDCEELVGVTHRRWLGLVSEYHFWSSHSLPQIITIL